MNLFVQINNFIHLTYDVSCLISRGNFLSSSTAVSSLFIRSFHKCSCTELPSSIFNGSLLWRLRGSVLIRRFWSNSLSIPSCRAVSELIWIWSLMKRSWKTIFNRTLSRWYWPSCDYVLLIYFIRSGWYLNRIIWIFRMRRVQILSFFAWTSSSIWLLSFISICALIYSLDKSSMSRMERSNINFCFLHFPLFIFSLSILLRRNSFSLFYNIGLKLRRRTRV